MTRLELWTAVLRLQRLAIQLARAEALSALTGRPLPADFEQTIAEAQGVGRSLSVELGVERARRRFEARYPAG
jgi:hypothetical protein